MICFLPLNSTHPRHDSVVLCEHPLADGNKGLAVRLSSQTRISCGVSYNLNLVSPTN